MALSLPYPGLSFVPLDELSAEEMNEIVANYTYIANQFPITSTNLATSLQNLIAGASYTSGSQWKPSRSTVCAGVLTGNTSGSPSVQFSIPLNKNTSAVSNITGYNITGTIRCPARRLLGTASGHSVYAPWGEILTPSSGTAWTNWTNYVQEIAIDGAAIFVKLFNSSGFKCEDSSYEPCNNAPVTIELGTTSYVTFS